MGLSCDSQLEGGLCFPGKKEVLACPLEDALRGLSGAVRGREGGRKNN